MPNHRRKRASASLENESSAATEPTVLISLKAAAPAVYDDTTSTSKVDQRPSKRKTSSISIAVPPPPLPHDVSALQPRDLAKINSIIQELDIEVESRCDELRKQAESLCESMRNAYRIQMMKLPAKIRQMTISTFMQEYAGSVETVLAEGVRKMQEDLDTWVAQTPRLRTARKGPSETPSSRVLRSARTQSRTQTHNQAEAAALPAAVVDSHPPAAESLSLASSSSSSSSSSSMSSSAQIARALATPAASAGGRSKTFLPQQPPADADPEEQEEAPIAPPQTGRRRVPLAERTASRPGEVKSGVAATPATTRRGRATAVSSRSTSASVRQPVRQVGHAVPEQTPVSRRRGVGAASGAAASTLRSSRVAAHSKPNNSIDSNDAASTRSSSVRRSTRASLRAAAVVNHDTEESSESDESDEEDTHHKRKGPRATNQPTGSRKGGRGKDRKVLEAETDATLDDAQKDMEDLMAQLQ